MWHYCKFDVLARDLDERTQQYADDPGEATLQSAQQAWRDAMVFWSQLELFQFGPLGSKAESAGRDMYEGRGIRDYVYAWPTTARCRVEEQLVSQAYAEHGMTSVLISGRGLFGLEYLLHYSGSDTACAAASATGTGWAELSESTLAERKRDYAVALASDVAQQIETLTQLWSPDGDNFLETFVTAGGMYPDEQEVMKVMAWALVYLEKEVKDYKLGIPAGYTLTHPVTHEETPFAQLGSDTLRANLEGFRSLFQGCGEAGEGLGFDDWLSEVGHAELASDMVSALANAQAVAEDFPPMQTASAEQIEELYQAVKALTVLLKSEFFGAGSPLNLQLPSGVASDTD
jgi:predicted lipoprotein